MSAAVELLAELHARGAHVRADGDQLRIRPASAVDSDLLERLRAAKPELLRLVRAAPPDLEIADRGREAREGAGTSAPTCGPPLTAEQRGELLDRSGFDMYSPHVPGGMCLVARDAQALEALGDEPVAVPVFFQAELEQLRDTLRTVRSVFAVELRRVTRTHVDG